MASDVHLRPKYTQGTQRYAAWGAIGRLIRVLFVWIILLILIHLHRKYPWDFGPQRLCGSGPNSRDLAYVQQYWGVYVRVTLRFIIFINYPRKIFP